MKTFFFLPKFSICHIIFEHFNLDILKHRLLLNDLFLDVHSVLLYLNAATYIHSISFCYSSSKDKYSK